MITEIAIYVGTIVLALLAFLISEYWRRKKGLGNETSRKFVHLFHGLLLATWPFLIGYGYVVFTELAFVAVIIITRRLGIASWMWKVGRRSWGEIAYPLGVVVAALLAESLWIYLAAVLILACADAAAALVGKRYGKNNSYQIIGQTKSIAGSSAFFIITFIVLIGVILASPVSLSLSVILVTFAVSLLLTTVENIGIYGVDNFLIPVSAVILLNLLN